MKHVFNNQQQNFYFYSPFFKANNREGATQHSSPVNTCQHKSLLTSQTRVNCALHWTPRQMLANNSNTEIDWACLTTETRRIWLETIAGLRRSVRNWSCLRDFRDAVTFNKREGLALLRSDAEIIFCCTRLWRFRLWLERWTNKIQFMKVLAGVYTF